MNLVLFTHPGFLGSQSMPRFANSLARAFTARGHRVQLRSPRARLRSVVSNHSWAKWAGYVDQYLLFPREIRSQLRDDPADTLYIFCDQALGPWVPLVADRPHVVHCHDLLALRSALGLIPENPTSATGRVYQRFIRRGFRQARHFISVSERSRADLHEFGDVRPVTSEVVYNGLNFPFAPLPAADAAKLLAEAGLPSMPGGMLLHVGGGQWYKNSLGVLEMYAAHAQTQPRPLPLWMISPAPTAAMRRVINALPNSAVVHFFQGLDSHVLQAAYAQASAFLFPSLAEGFGWPIAEAMACGCPVITTGEPPMNEVGGPVAYYLPRRGSSGSSEGWAQAAAALLGQVLQAPHEERAARREAGLAWVRRFDPDQAIDRYLQIYELVLALEDMRRRSPAVARGRPA